MGLGPLGHWVRVLLSWAKYYGVEVTIIWMRQGVPLGKFEERARYGILCLVTPLSGPQFPHLTSLSERWGHL